MGSAASRPRPRPADQNQPPYQGYSGAAGAAPYYSSNPRGPGAYGPGYQNNGQYYSGYQCPRPGGPGQRPAFQGQNNAQGPDVHLSQTTTIRNAVNVKKPSITAVSEEGAPNKLVISFNFDASAPCLATVFVAAVEDTSADSKIIPSCQSPPPGVLYGKGLNLSFQKTAGQPRPAVIDLESYASIDELLEVKETPRGSQYPLIIRLETITEEGLAEGHSLSELVPGDSQKPWVQSQTTFAQLAKEEDGNYRVRPLKQKILVKGVSYELQEIYGIEHATAAAREREGIVTGTVASEAEDERSCVICLVNSRDTTILPCRHMCMCHDCAEELRKQTSKCPICRNHVEALLHIRMANTQSSKNSFTPGESAVSAALDKLGLKSSAEKR